MNRYPGPGQSAARVARLLPVPLPHSSNCSTKVRVRSFSSPTCADSQSSVLQRQVSRRPCRESKRPRSIPEVQVATRGIRHDWTLWSKRLRVSAAVGSPVTQQTPAAARNFLLEPFLDELALIRSAAAEHFRCLVSRQRSVHSELQPQNVLGASRLSSSAPRTALHLCASQARHVGGRPWQQG